MTIENKPIYVITTFEKLPEGDNPWLDMGCSRSPGFYYSFEEAETSIINNNCDLWETCYDYACISEIYPGLYNVDEKEQLYKYNIKTNKYEKLENTVTLFSVCGIG